MKFSSDMLLLYRKGLFKASTASEFFLIKGETFLIKSETSKANLTVKFKENDCRPQNFRPQRPQSHVSSLVT